MKKTHVFVKAQFDAPTLTHSNSEHDNCLFVAAHIIAIVLLNFTTFLLNLLYFLLGFTLFIELCNRLNLMISIQGSAFRWFPCEKT